MRYLGCEEVAVKYNVKRRTVWSWIRNKRLRAIRTGRNYCIRSTDLEEFEKQCMTIQGQAED